MNSMLGGGEFVKRSLTLDLVGLSDEQKSEGSILLGGSAAEFVTLGDKFNYENVESVVFRWGDAKIEEVFAHLIEHRLPELPMVLPFTMEAVVGDNLWSLVLQHPEFDPQTAYYSPDLYSIVPFNENLATLEIELIYVPTGTRKQVLGLIANRYVLFEMAVSLTSS
jgi:hypothetical protein